jgi:hypothetical protein
MARDSKISNIEVALSSNTSFPICISITRTKYRGNKWLGNPIKTYYVSRESLSYKRLAEIISSIYYFGFRDEEVYVNIMSNMLGWWFNNKSVLHWACAIEGIGNG